MLSHLMQQLSDLLFFLSVGSMPIWSTLAERFWGERVACLAAWLVAAICGTFAAALPLTFNYCRQFPDDAQAEPGCEGALRSVIVLGPFFIIFTGIALWRAIVRTRDL
jgi:hypothetical protein